MPAIAIGEAARNDLLRFHVATEIFGKDAPGGGRELSATLKGADGQVFQLGRTAALKVDDVIALGKADTKAGKVPTLAKLGASDVAGITTGSLTITDEMVAIDDIAIAGPVAITGVSWTVAAANTQHITMARAALPQPVTIDRIEARFTKVATGKIVAGREVTKSKFAGYSVAGLTIPKVEASDFRYIGKTIVPDGTKYVDLKFASASLTGVSVARLDKDAATGLLKVDAKVAGAGVQGFGAHLISEIQGKLSSQKFGADITSGESAPRPNLPHPARARTPKP